MVLKPHSKSFKLWKNPPIALNFDVYLYNWTNPTNLTEDDFEKPIVEQIGPYRFTEVTEKSNVKWHPKNLTISFDRRSVYYFNAEESVGRLDDMITTVNAVAMVRVSIAAFLRTHIFIQISFVLSTVGGSVGQELELL